MAVEVSMAVLRVGSHTDTEVDTNVSQKRTVFIFRAEVQTFL
jgi:hypothetical protein